MAPMCPSDADSASAAPPMVKKSPTKKPSFVKGGKSMVGKR